MDEGSGEGSFNFNLDDLSLDEMLEAASTLPQPQESAMEDGGITRTWEDAHGPQTRTPQRQTSTVGPIFSVEHRCAVNHIAVCTVQKIFPFPNYHGVSQLEGLSKGQQLMSMGVNLPP